MTTTTTTADYTLIAEGERTVQRLAQTDPAVYAWVVHMAAERGALINENRCLSANLDTQQRTVTAWREVAIQNGVTIR